MSDFAAPEPRIPGSEFDILIESARTTNEDWLERLVTNGPMASRLLTNCELLNRGYLN